MQVKWSDPALDDIEAIKTYISKDSPHYARAFIERIFTAVDRLLNFPLSGRVVPEAEDQEVREIIVQSYRVMYRIEANSLDQDYVLMLAVMHGSRDLKNPYNQPWETH